jgi:hypothetical protein
MQVTPEQVHRITENVLARQEFSEKLTWSQMLMDEILRWFNALIDWSARNPAGARVQFHHDRVRRPDHIVLCQ